MDAHLRFHGFTGKRLHLGVCGSVAAFRAAELVHKAGRGSGRQRHADPRSAAIHHTSDF